MTEIIIPVVIDANSYIDFRNVCKSSISQFDLGRNASAHKLKNKDNKSLAENDMLQDFNICRDALRIILPKSYRNNHNPKLARIIFFYSFITFDVQKNSFPFLSVKWYISRQKIHLIILNSISIWFKLVCLCVYARSLNHPNYVIIGCCREQWFVPRLKLHTLLHSKLKRIIW